MAPILYRYDIAPNVAAFSTTRHGGVSQGNYSELNINPYCGDQLAHVSANRQLLAATLHIPSSRIVVPHQVHGVESLTITDDFFLLPADEQQAMTEGMDAVMTDCRNVCIGVSTADCIPVLLYDPRHHAAAAIHAGWRGTVARIVVKAVDGMAQAFRTRPQELIAVIAPGISLHRFEVGDEVYDAFARQGHDMARIARRYEKWHLDLPLCTQLQLEEAGVSSGHIHQSGICTYDAVDDFFSARRLGIASGRIYTGIILR